MSDFVTSDHPRSSTDSISSFPPSFPRPYPAHPNDRLVGLDKGKARAIDSWHSRAEVEGVSPSPGPSRLSLSHEETSQSPTSPGNLPLDQPSAVGSSPKGKARQNDASDTPRPVQKLLNLPDLGEPFSPGFAGQTYDLQSNEQVPDHWQHQTANASLRSSSSSHKRTFLEAAISPSSSPTLICAQGPIPRCSPHTEEPLSERRHDRTDEVRVLHSLLSKRRRAEHATNSQEVPEPPPQSSSSPSSTTTRSGPGRHSPGLTFTPESTLEYRCQWPGAQYSQTRTDRLRDLTVRSANRDRATDNYATSHRFSLLSNASTTSSSDGLRSLRSNSPQALQSTSYPLRRTAVSSGPARQPHSLSRRVHPTPIRRQEVYAPPQPAFSSVMHFRTSELSDQTEPSSLTTPDMETSIPFRDSMHRARMHRDDYDELEARARLDTSAQHSLLSLSALGHAPVDSYDLQRSDNGSMSLDDAHLPSSFTRHNNGRRVGSLGASGRLRGPTRSANERWLGGTSFADNRSNDEPDSLMSEFSRAVDLSREDDDSRRVGRFLTSNPSGDDRVAQDRVDPAPQLPDLRAPSPFVMSFLASTSDRPSFEASTNHHRRLTYARQDLDDVQRASPRSNSAEMGSSTVLDSGSVNSTSSVDTAGSIAWSRFRPLNLAQSLSTRSDVRDRRAHNLTQNSDLFDDDASSLELRARSYRERDSIRQQTSQESASLRLRRRRPIQDPSLRQTPDPHHELDDRFFEREILTHQTPVENNMWRRWRARVNVSETEERLENRLRIAQRTDGEPGGSESEGLQHWRANHQLDQLDDVAPIPTPQADAESALRSSDSQSASARTRQNDQPGRSLRPLRILEGLVPRRETEQASEVSSLSSRVRPESESALEYLRRLMNHDNGLDDLAALMTTEEPDEPNPRVALPDEASYRYLRHWGLRQASTSASLRDRIALDPRNFMADEDWEGLDSYESLLLLGDRIGAADVGVPLTVLNTFPSCEYGRWDGGSCKLRDDCPTPPDKGKGKQKVQASQRDTMCPICRGDYLDPDVLISIPKCDHAFHADCLRTWFKAANTCPMCRADVLDDVRVRASVQPGALTGLD